MTVAPGGGFVEVADRVFVARYRQWDVNVGLVLGRHGAVVIDTRASDVQGAQVLEDIRRLGRDVVVRHVVSTHVHFDHTFGNAAFETAIVHAHDNVGRTTHTAAEHIEAPSVRTPAPPRSTATPSATPPRCWRRPSVAPTAPSAPTRPSTSVTGS